MCLETLQSESTRSFFRDNIYSSRNADIYQSTNTKKSGQNNPTTAHIV